MEDTKIDNGAGPDFSDVLSMQDAQRRVDEGQLVGVYLFPVELGGAVDPINLIFITPAAAEAQALIIDSLISFVEEGLINQLNVEPVYRGASFVPSQIIYRAYHSERDGRFEPTIDVW